MPEPEVIFTFEGQDVTLTFQGHRIIGNSLYVNENNVMTSYVCVAENRCGQAKEEVSGRFQDVALHNRGLNFLPTLLFLKERICS